MTISIHALLAESDFFLVFGVSFICIFLSTLSLRRATNCTSIGRPKRLYFYPRSPCGERQRAEIRASSQQEFLSTLSLRRATPRGGSCYLDNIISIHALLAESDPLKSESLTTYLDFYPRSPCGERLIFSLPLVLISLFLSTLSLRRATCS